MPKLYLFTKEIEQAIEFWKVQLHQVDWTDEEIGRFARLLRSRLKEKALETAMTQTAAIAVTRMLPRVSGDIYSLRNLWCELRSNYGLVGLLAKVANDVGMTITIRHKRGEIALGHAHTLIYPGLVIVKHLEIDEKWQVIYEDPRRGTGLK